MLHGLKNLSAAVKYYADCRPDKIYIIDNDQNCYTYRQINNMINHACVLYKSLEMKHGDIVSAILKNSIEYIVMYLASLRYGTVFNPYPYTLEAHDLVRHLANVQPKLILCQKRHYEKLKKHNQYHYENASSPHDTIDKVLGYPIVPIDIYFSNSMKSRPWQQSMFDDEVPYWEDFVPASNSPACLYYSSATTGDPKNILVSHQNIISNIESLVRGFRFTEKETHLIALPLGHTAAINYSFLPCTLCGATIVLAESFWKIRHKFWSLIKQHNVTYIQLVPSVLFALLNTPYLSHEVETNSIRFIGCGSSTLPVERQIQFYELFGIKVANLYGLSETGPTHVDYPLDPNWKPGSIGKPLDVNKVLIVDEDDAILITGEVGEIIIAGENVCVDYYNNHILYNETVKNGYFHTGDLGYIDENGKHFFVGRKKELIIKGGMNIAPDEIDEILYQLSEVAEAVTVGKPNEYLGETICSYIVLKKEHIWKDLDNMAKDITHYCKKFLSREKIPDKILFVSSIPKGHSGKMLRRQVEQ